MKYTSSVSDILLTIDGQPINIFEKVILFVRDIILYQAHLSLGQVNVQDDRYFVFIQRKSF